MTRETAAIERVPTLRFLCCTMRRRQRYNVGPRLRLTAVAPLTVTVQFTLVHGTTTALLLTPPLPTHANDAIPRTHAGRS